jgi:hypothetical protein
MTEPSNSRSCPPADGAGTYGDFKVYMEPDIRLHEYGKMIDHVN